MSHKNTENKGLKKNKIGLITHSVYSSDVYKKKTVIPTICILCKPYID